MGPQVADEDNRHASNFAASELLNRSDRGASSVSTYTVIYRPLPPAMKGTPPKATALVQD
jgi:hypothetical protein